MEVHFVNRSTTPIGCYTQFPLPNLVGYQHWKFHVPFPSIHQHDSLITLVFITCLTENVLLVRIFHNMGR